VSIASFNDKIKDLTIVVNGVSKSYAMTGWRIGYTASNEQIAKIMANVQSHATSNPNSIAQKAALAALEGPQEIIDEMSAEFVKRRDYMVDRINSMNGGILYKTKRCFLCNDEHIKAYRKEIAGMKITGSDSFAEALLEKANVALVPGSGFGTDIHVRLSYATSMENIVEGLNRIEKFLSM